jgi:hypothetical protein
MKLQVRMFSLAAPRLDLVARRHHRLEGVRHVQALAALAVSRVQYHVRLQVVVVLQLPVLAVKDVSK